MPDYNPDREGHHQHKFTVLDATRRNLEHVPNHPELKFNHQGRLRLKDAGLAREIQQETRDVSVTLLKHPHRSDRGHVYFFGQWPEMPWKKEKQDGDN